MDITTNPAMDRGRSAFTAGEYAAAEAHFRDALAAGHDDVELHHHLGFLARERGDLLAAADHYVQALRRAPSDPQLHNNLGEVRRSQGQLPQAVTSFRRALALAPDTALIATNLGSTLLALHRPDLALPYLNQAVAIDAGQVVAQSERAICLCSLNRYADAAALYCQIYRDRPAANDARYLEALALLALGDFANGWRKHETRWYTPLGKGFRRIAPGPYWRGPYPSAPDRPDPHRRDDNDLAGRTLFVHAEQGHGDTIQFLRYIPTLRASGVRVLLEVQPLLKPLLAGDQDAYARGEDIPPYDAQCSFMSLPWAFRTTLQTVPADVPYVSVPEDRLACWRRRLGVADGRRRIGIAWTGTSAVWNRSIPLPLLARLLARDDCEFHVIQTTMEPGDTETLQHLPRVIDHSAELQDFADTAALTTMMDLIISVDTALVHLAGALAKPVWTMLPFGAEYRWMTEGTTSPWYPTMRLFRQPVLFGWPEVVNAVNAALDA